MSDTDLILNAIGVVQTQTGELSKKIDSQGEALRDEIKSDRDKNSEQHKEFYETLGGIAKRNARKDGESEAEEKAEAKMAVVANLQESKEKTGIMSRQSFVTIIMAIITVASILYGLTKDTTVATAKNSNPKVVIHENTDRK